MRIGLDSGFSDAAKILLRVAIVTIISFRREPTIDVIPVSHHEPAGVRAALQISIAVGVLCEETSALEAHLGTPYQSNGPDRQHHDSRNDDQYPSHPSLPPWSRIKTPSSLDNSIDMAGVV